MTLRSRHLTTSAKPGQPNDRPPAPASPPPPRWRMWLLPVGVLITLLLLSIPHTSSTPTKSFSYSTFLSNVTSGDVRTASVNPSGAVTGTLKGGDNYTSQIPTAARSAGENPLRCLISRATGVARSADTSATAVIDPIPRWPGHDSLGAVPASSIED